MVEQTLIEELIGAIKQDPKIRNRTHSAVVARVDDEGVVWVYVAGSDQETPTATTSAEVKRGDGVMVEWRNDRLYIVGNTTDPSAGKARVQAVEDAAAKAGAAASRALTAAASAEESAETAATAAAKAVEDADKAGKAAKEADQKAVAAGTAADNAQKSANIAQESAHNASEYAARALGNLSTVQSVTETLNWITTHGTMTKTDDYAPSTDTEVVEGKKYYSRSGSGTAQDPYVYTLISNPTGDPSASGYYEGVLDPTHVYFVQDNAGDYEVAGVRYAIVTEPKVEDIADYYVLSIDESLNNYVATHLALLNDGLYVMADNSEWKVKIADNGVFILDPNNKAANSMQSDKNVIGYTDKMHIEVDNDSLEIFDDNGDSISSFGASGVRIGKDEAGSAFITINNDSVNINKNYANVKIGTSGIELWNYYDQLVFAANKSGVKFKPTLLGRGFYIEDSGNSSEGCNISFSSNSNVTAHGRTTEAKNYSFAMGDDVGIIGGQAKKTIATGRCSFSQGQATSATGDYSHAQGSQTSAEGDKSCAFNTSTVAGYNSQTVIGVLNDNQPNTAFEIGNGTTDPTGNNRSNALTVDWDGNIETALDTTAAAGTIDGDLYAAITALGWESEVID